MGRKFCITEEQYNMALREGVTIAANTQDGIENGVKDAANQAKQKGLKPTDYDISVSGTSANSVTESKFITKKQLQENRLKEMKKNSEVYTVKDFINKFQ